MKSRWDEVKSEERRCNSAKVRREKIHPRKMLEESRNAVFFLWFVCPVSRKVGSLKRRVRRYVVRGEIKNCTPLWREAHFQVKMLKNWRCRTTFSSSAVEKLHAAVARSTFPSQNAKKLRVSEHFLKFTCLKMARRCGQKHINVKKLTVSDHFWKCRYRKIARRCGEKHIFKSKCEKLTVSDHFLTLRCLKIARRCGEKHIFKSKCEKLTVSDHFLTLRCRKIARRCGEKHICKSKCAKYLCFGTLFEVQMSKN